MSLDCFQVLWSFHTHLFLLLFELLVGSSKVLLLLDDIPCEHLTVRLLSRDTPQELLWAQFAVSVKIQPPDDGRIILKHHTLCESPFEKVIESFD